MRYCNGVSPSSRLADFPTLAKNCQTSPSKELCSRCLAPSQLSNPKGSQRLPFIAKYSVRINPLAGQGSAASQSPAAIPCKQTHQVPGQ
ncbi:UNVERIFIED_CONTAM: hypothetical protein FKN15_007877 [Acipenser sinensis]